MCDSCEWKESLLWIEDVLGATDGSADGFLESVYSWVEEHEHVTQSQKDKIEEIEDGI